MNKESFSFVIYTIHACANRWGKSPSEVYEILDRSECIGKYLVPHFDILHTQGVDYIVEDIVNYLNVSGIKI